MKKKQITAIDKMRAHSDIEVPFHVWRFFGEGCKTLIISGTQASPGEDFGSEEELRAALDWYVAQLGGKVTWNK
jgi:hypothetical protein